MIGRPMPAGREGHAVKYGPARPAPWFDPGWHIWRGLRTAEASAEDAYLLWLLRLPDEQDPAAAADRVLAAYAPSAEADLAVLCRDAPEAARLLTLMEQTRSYPRGRLAGYPRGRRGRQRQRRRT